MTTIHKCDISRTLLELNRMQASQRDSYVFGDGIIIIITADMNKTEAFDDAGLAMVSSKDEHGD